MTKLFFIVVACLPMACLAQLSSGVDDKTLCWWVRNNEQLNSTYRSIKASAVEEARIRGLKCESLPACPSRGSKDGCFGEAYWGDELYIGEWKNGKPSGAGRMGVRYGIWNERVQEKSWTYSEWKNYLDLMGEKKQSLIVDERFAKEDSIRTVFQNKFNALPRQMDWTAKLNSIVGDSLKSWLEEDLSTNTPEIQPPVFPPPLNLSQEKWETNKEFEDRISSSRSSRQKEIDRIQSQYKNKVDSRNSEIQRLTKLRADKEKQLPSKKKEILLQVVQYIKINLESTAASLDQDNGTLYVDVSVDQSKPERFAFRDAPQQIRRDALTSPSALPLKAEFFVGDSGQFGIKAINIESAGVKVVGTPTQGSAGSQNLRLATIDVPVSNLPVLTQQSAITVDKNQVEQILYRDENESLRKRLDEQRRAQELALSEQARRVEQETAKFKAEAEAAKRRQQELEKQLAQSSGNKSQINYGRALNAHALVIGNSAYSGGAKLANPQNDAKSVSSKLRELGFKVTEVVDADRVKLVTSLSTFAATAQSADLTMLFYAGHGVQISGTNYMLPVDLNMNDLSQVPLQGVSLSSVVEQYLPGKTKLVFLDACRDNPLMQTASRSVSRGLAPINVSEGTLISYSTKDGQVAQDGDGKNSPFTKALLDHLDDPEDIAVVLRKVREQVMKNTGGKQQPWEYGSLTGGSLVLSAIKQK
jgi:hypothetical protein